MKYYTPSLDEFHNNFNYEELVNGEWLPTEFGLKTRFNLSEVRVKYLDRSDIESMGFRFLDGDGVFDKYTKEVESSTTIAMCDLYIHWIGDEPFITIVIDNDMTPLICDLNIKNLNEFKWILNRYGLVGNNR